MVVATRTKLIQAAQASMLKRGYSATGVDDICRDAGVSKGSFYHQFESKEALAIAALGDFYAAGVAHLLAIDVSRVPRAEQWLVFLDAVAQRGHEFWEYGCLMGSLASEMAIASEPLQREVGRLFSETARALEPMTEPFAASIASQTLTAAALAEHFLAVVEGAIVLARAHDDPLKIDQAVARFAEQLRGLRLRKKTSVRRTTKKEAKR